MNITKYNNILKEYKAKTFERGDIIFQEGDNCYEVAIIKSGEVKISTITTNEKEEIISVLKDGEIFGNNLIFSSEPIYLGDVVVTRKSEIIFLNESSLIKIFKENTDFLKDYLKEISDKAILIKQQNKLLAHKNISDRIMFYFDTLSKKQKSKTIVIPSITKLSMILSLPRPSVSRELTNLENKGLIKKNKYEIIIK